MPTLPLSNSIPGLLGDSCKGKSKVFAEPGRAHWSPGEGLSDDLALSNIRRLMWPGMCLLSCLDSNQTKSLGQEGRLVLGEEAAHIPISVLKCDLLWF